MNAVVWISKEAKRLQKAHPRQYANWKDAQAAATKKWHRAGPYVPSGSKKVTHKKKPMAKKTHRRPAKKKARPRPRKRTAIAAAPRRRSKVGSVAYHTKMAKKIVDEQLAWKLLAIDSATKKSIKNKLLKQKAALKKKQRALSA